MTTSRFPDALAFTLGPNIEGGFNDDPSDHGGPTNAGVTQAVYDAYRVKSGLPQQSVALISQDEISDIYRSEYWEPMGGDNLPVPLDLVCFDTAVNCGVGQAAKFLQRSVNVNDDGIVGPKTLAAISWAGTPQMIANNVLDQREKFNQHFEITTPSDTRFENGWENRINALRKLVSP